MRKLTEIVAIRASLCLLYSFLLALALHMAGGLVISLIGLSDIDNIEVLLAGVMLVRGVSLVAFMVIFYIFVSKKVFPKIRCYKTSGYDFYSIVDLAVSAFIVIVVFVVLHYLTYDIIMNSMILFVLDDVYESSLFLFNLGAIIVVVSYGLVFTWKCVNYVLNKE